jgi:hypothetical protein
MNMNLFPISTQRYIQKYLLICFFLIDISTLFCSHISAHATPRILPSLPYLPEGGRGRALKPLDVENERRKLKNIVKKKKKKKSHATRER